jgi:transposase
MTIAHRFIGIDISKAYLDIYDEATGKSERIANNRAAIAAILARWPRAGLRVIFEATGSYDRGLRTALAAADLGYVRVNLSPSTSFQRATSSAYKRLARVLAVRPEKGHSRKQTFVLRTSQAQMASGRMRHR